MARSPKKNPASPRSKAPAPAATGPIAGSARPTGGRGKAANPPDMADFRHGGPPPHGSKRKNNPPAAIAAEGTVRAIPKAEYAYNPHLPPVLRFDQHGKADVVNELAAKVAAGKPLSEDERALAAAAIRAKQGGEPWLEWTGKREKPAFTVDPVALHIHERVSAQAILKVAARQDVNKFLFADPQQEYHEAVQFYKHDVDWSNRLILGDSLQVMSSLARREDLAGKVQMIYMDPPYGIKFASNFQPEVGKRDVKDKQEDMTREPEMVRAYRDTWHLGIHSYLSYLRDRLVVAKELLADTGSIFVQISDENLHRVRNVMDEVLGAQNYCGQIVFRKTTGKGGQRLDNTYDLILWFAKRKEQAKYRSLYEHRDIADEDNLRLLAFVDGTTRRMTDEEVNGSVKLPVGCRVFRPNPMTNQRPAQGNDLREYSFEGKRFTPSLGTFRTDLSGLNRMTLANRLVAVGNSLTSIRYLDDFACKPRNDIWDDTRSGGYGEDKVYVVQTNSKVIARCMLMTTDPGDLVLDPTCGSGTTAYVAEQWGRRWITTDTSRVAIAIARQRLLTSKFEQYRVKDIEGARDQGIEAGANPGRGFSYKTVPHIQLKNIAQNVALDPIFAKHEPLLEAALKKANVELAKVMPPLKAKLAGKLAAKERTEGKRAVTDADRRRWLLPPECRDRSKEARAKATVDLDLPSWQHWEVPFDTDADWPAGLAEAVKAYRAAWRAKMDEVNACIAASAEQEELVDQPEVIRGVVRVTGPFTVEAVQPPEMSLGDVMEDGGEFGGAPEEADGTFAIRMVEPKNTLEVANIGAYLDQMFRFIKADGVRFLGNKQMQWSRLEPLFESGGGAAGMGFHAEGRWTTVGETDGDPDGRANVAVAFGPQYGPVTGPVVVDLLRNAHRRGYDHVVIAGFNFDGMAQAEAEGLVNSKVKVHLAHVRPDINPGMAGLLKESPKAGSGQLFTVFGQPRIGVAEQKGEDGKAEYVVTMEGVDLYDPVKDEIRSSGADKVAAWFLDSDYDGRTFCITQAFFPDKGAWEKLAKALNGKDGLIDAERFAALSGTTSLPFPAGKHKCVAVKVIDPRGNEVMAVERL